MVPRTFLGPIVVSSLAYPAVMILKFVGSSKLWSQYVGNLHFMEYFFDISITILHYYLKCNLETGHLAFTNLLTCPAYFCFNPLTPKISLVILSTVSHTVLVMLVWRIWDCLNL